MSKDAPIGDIAQGTTGEFSAPRLRSRRKFLGEVVAFGAAVGLATAGGIDVYNFVTEAATKAEKAYPPTFTPDQVQAARQQITVFNRQSEELAREGALSKIPQVINGQELQQAYATVDNDTSVKNKKDALLDTLYEEQLPIVPVNRFAAGLGAAVIGGGSLFVGTSRILDLGTGFLQRQVNNFSQRNSVSPSETK